MILLGCLLALGLAVAPRLFLVIAWLFADRWPVVWGDAWSHPCWASSSSRTPP